MIFYHMGACSVTNPFVPFMSYVRTARIHIPAMLLLPPLLLPLINVSIDKVFTNRHTLNQHLKRECVHFPIEDFSHLMDTSSVHFYIKFNSVLRGCMSEYVFVPRDHLASEKMCLDYLEHDFIKLLEKYAGEDVILKWSFTLDVIFVRLNAEGEEETASASFSSEEHAFLNSSSEQRQ